MKTFRRELHKERIGGSTMVTVGLMVGEKECEGVLVSE